MQHLSRYLQNKYMDKNTHTITLVELARAFDEWDRIYREEPLRFKREIEHLLNSTKDQYGRVCAIFLLKLIDEGSLTL